MIKFYLIVLMLVFSVSTVSAQTLKSYGLRTGSNVSTVSGNTNDMESVFGYTIGASITFRIDDHLSFRPELCYSTKGYKYAYEDDGLSYMIETEFIFGYIEMPFLFVYSLSKNINFIGGTYIEFFSEGSIQSPDHYYGEIGIDKEAVDSPGYGLIFGIEYCTDYAMFGVRYSMGLSNIYNSFSSDLKHQVIQFTFGFNVPLGKKEEKN